MGLILLSLILALIFGCCFWLVIGKIFPLNQEKKWPALNNIISYSLFLAPAVYLIIFSLA